MSGKTSAGRRSPFYTGARDTDRERIYDINCERLHDRVRDRVASGDRRLDLAAATDLRRR
jgi:hypothetical protein